MNGSRFKVLKHSKFNWGIYADNVKVIKGKAWDTKRLLRY